MTTVVAAELEVTGVVQGVGFRPFVHRLAAELGLGGHVGNDSSRVFIAVEGPPRSVDEFLDRLVADAPPLAVIDSVIRRPVPAGGIAGFRIVESRTATGERTLVPPDTAVCDECVAEMLDPRNRRHRHPFITCTNCGPRYSIIEALPYDRANTTMAGFDMCAACRAEFEDPTDRRHHAQPIACHDCGPRLRFRGRSGGDVPDHRAVEHATRELALGSVVAVKGIGGYHLACDAASDDALRSLRARKLRPAKPFAVMVADLEEARRIARVDASEAELLASAARPIVLLRAATANGLSGLVAPENPLLGVMLPYAPLHHLLFAGHPAPLVMTSANQAGEPIVFDDGDSAERLAPLCDAVLTHDRPIRVPVDDSVVRIVDGAPLPLRRARGYAPVPVRLHHPRRQVLAAGGDLKNTTCITSTDHAWVSQHLGDMGRLGTQRAFEDGTAHLRSLFGVEPDVIAVDAHPGYRSTRWGRGQAGPPILEVQHHHAHIAAVMAEHCLDPERPVLGFAFDGTGYGTDGAVWGGEALVADASGFTRVGHLHPVPLAGGDLSVRRPWRMALAHLFAAGVDWASDLAPVRHPDEVERSVLRRQLESGFGCVPTTSMGRLFDAVAALVGLRQEVSFEAQAAIDLEVAAAAASGRARYRFGFEPPVIDPAPVVRAIVDDLARSVPTADIARGFHDAVAAAVHRVAAEIRRSGGPASVVLAGGVFQNALLASCTMELLRADGFEVYTHRRVPPNDGGLSLGQAFVAAHCPEGLIARHTGPAEEI